MIPYIVGGLWRMKINTILSSVLPEGLVNFPPLSCNCKRRLGLRARWAKTFSKMAKQIEQMQKINGNLINYKLSDVGGKIIGYVKWIHGMVIVGGFVLRHWPARLRRWCGIELFSTFPIISLVWIIGFKILTHTLMPIYIYIYIHTVYIYIYIYIYWHARDHPKL